MSGWTAGLRIQEPRINSPLLSPPESGNAPGVRRGTWAGPGGHGCAAAPAVKSPRRLANQAWSGYHHAPAQGADHAPAHPPLRAVVLAPLSCRRRPGRAGPWDDCHRRRRDDRAPGARGRRRAAGHRRVAAARGRLEANGIVPGWRAPAVGSRAPGGGRDRLLAGTAEQRPGGAALSGLGGRWACGGALPPAGAGVAVGPGRRGPGGRRRRSLDPGPGAARLRHGLPRL